jgi:hypothetical protein
VQFRSVSLTVPSLKLTLKWPQVCCPPELSGCPWSHSMALETAALFAHQVNVDPAGHPARDADVQKLSVPNHDPIVQNTDY